MKLTKEQAINMRDRIVKGLNASKSPNGKYNPEEGCARNELWVIVNYIVLNNRTGTKGITIPPTYASTLSKHGYL